MILLLAAHAAVAGLAPAMVARWGRQAFWVCATVPAATAVWALAATPDVSSRTSGHRVESVEWIPSLDLNLTFRLDSLAWLMTLVVAAVGALVLVYCSRYFAEGSHATGRFAGLLTAFAGAMLGLVTTDDMLLLYVMWEITTVLSYLLIGHEERERASRAAAGQALIVTTVGGLAMLAGIVMLGQHLGSYQLSEVVVLARQAPPTATLTWAAVLVLVGAVSKSALFPFHFWLPGAMAAPTPVSAYLHAAAMVKAGIYLVARLAPGFAWLPAWQATVLVLGGGTMLLGAYRALRQHDLKLLLAFGTVSQLGFLVVLTGTGTSQAALAGLTMLLAHAMYKGALFLVVGVIDHATGTRDLRRLSGLRRQMPGLWVTACLAAASMAGVPPLLGFVGKEAVYATYSGSTGSWSIVILVVLVAGSVLTVGYSARFIWGGFRTLPDQEPTAVHDPGRLLPGVPMVLAVGGLVAGLTSGPLEPHLAGYAAALPDDGPPIHLGLWHGLGAPLYLSLLTLALGAGVFLLRKPVNRTQSRIGRVTGRMAFDDLYRAALRLLDHGSLRLTGAVQRGSLPLSLALILISLLVWAGGSLLITNARIGPLVPFDNAGQVVTVAVIAFAAVLATVSRRRLRAVFLVATTSYGVSVLFLLHGGPDLALTQILAETVSLLVFVLVLRRLPSKFTDEPLANRVRRSVFALGCGGLVTALALVVPQVRRGDPASAGLADSAVSYGGGDNIVNVILVDVRAWDTMGELSVVIAAATGIASLVFLREENLEVVRAVRRRMRLARARAGTGARRPKPDPGRRWLPEVSVHPYRRSLMLEVVVRTVFYPVVLWSLFLLFTGHNNPGGGFAAGLVAGLAIAMRYLAGGRAELGATAPISPALLLGAGLFLSAGTGLVSMAFGGAVLESWIVDIPVPVIGNIHLVTSVFFDVGVYLVVIGLVQDILRSLGEGIDRQGGPALEEPLPLGDAPATAARPQARPTSADTPSGAPSVGTDETEVSP